MTPLYLDAVLFDMDGTLIDDSRSYREATRLTADFLLDAPVSDQQIAQIKRLPGFNNDWDTTWAVVEYARTGVIRAPSDNDRLSTDYARVRSIFQTYYLGDRVWRERSGETPPLRWSEPLILRETLLVSRESLNRFASFSLGIATSRPRAEALMAIEQHALERFFDPGRLVGLEDASHEKPHPASLLALVDRLGCASPAYVGDTVNDAMAAMSAGMPFVHIGRDSFDDPAIEEAITCRVDSVNDLVDLVHPISRRTHAWPQMADR